MEIPEIRFLIGLHLHGHDLKVTRRSLAKCVRVSKDWQEIFIPLLYGTIDTSHFSGDVPRRTRFASLTLGLQRHGRHLTGLSISLPSLYLDILATTTGNIRHLSIVDDKTVAADQGTLNSQFKLRTLLNNNPQIESVSMSLRFIRHPSRFIGQIVQHCRRLQKFEVIGTSFDLADLLYLNGLLYLSDICISKCGIKATGGPLLRVPSLPSLRQVDLSFIDDDAMPAVIEIISNSLHLDRLSLTCDGVPSPPTQDALQTLQPSPRLSCLELMSVHTTDQDLARILDECPALTNLCLFNVHVGEASLTSLIGLAGTLTHLTLTFENDRGYWTPRRILCSLPKLVEFCCSRIDIDEMFFDWAGEQKFSASWKIWQVKERFQSEFDNEDDDGHVKDHLLGRWICRGLQRLDTAELILSPNNDRNQAFIHEWQQLQHLTDFVADHTSCRVLATQVSDFYPSSLKSEETPKMQGATRAAETNICLDRRSLMQDPKLQCIPAIWPKIQSYRGPTFSRSMT